MTAVKFFNGLRLLLGGALLGFTCVSLLAPVVGYETSTVTDWLGMGLGSSVALLMAKFHILSL